MPKVMSEANEREVAELAGFLRFSAHTWSGSLRGIRSETVLPSKGYLKRSDVFDIRDRMGSLV